MEMGDPGLPRWAQCHHQGLMRGRQEGQGQRKGAVLTEAGVLVREQDLRKLQCSLRVEEGGINQRTT